MSWADKGKLELNHVRTVKYLKITFNGLLDMTKPYLIVSYRESLDGVYRGDSENIPQQLMDANIERALQTFRKMKEFQHIKFHLGRPTYVFLLEDSCPSTKDDWATVSITDRGDMKYVFIYNDPRPEERWWIDYQPVDESGTATSTERCVGWFTDEFLALEEAKDILSKPDRKSRVN